MLKERYYEFRKMLRKCIVEILIKEKIKQKGMIFIVKIFERN